MGAKTLWARRAPYENSDVELYEVDPIRADDAFTTFVLHASEWRDMGGIYIRQGGVKRVRITVEEVRSDGE